MRNCEVLVPTVTDVIDAAVISQAGPQLRLIANYGNGVDNIDVQSALNRGITVTNTPGVLTEDTADMTLALILAVPRRIAEGMAAHGSARVIEQHEFNPESLKAALDDIVARHGDYERNASRLMELAANRDGARNIADRVLEHLRG